MCLPSYCCPYLYFLQVEASIKMLSVRNLQEGSAFSSAGSLSASPRPSSQCSALVSRPNQHLQYSMTLESPWACSVPACGLGWAGLLTFNLQGYLLLHIQKFARSLEIITLLMRGLALLLVGW